MFIFGGYLPNAYWAPNGVAEDRPHLVGVFISGSRLCPGLAGSCEEFSARGQASTSPAESAQALIHSAVQD